MRTTSTFSAVLVAIAIVQGAPLRTDTSPSLGHNQVSKHPSDLDFIALNTQVDINKESDDPSHMLLITRTELPSKLNLPRSSLPRLSSSKSKSSTSKSKSSKSKSSKSKSKSKPSKSKPSKSNTSKSNQVQPGTSTAYQNSNIPNTGHESQPGDLEQQDSQDSSTDDTVESPEEDTKQDSKDASGDDTNGDTSNASDTDTEQYSQDSSDDETTGDQEPSDQDNTSEDGSEVNALTNTTLKFARTIENNRKYKRSTLLFGDDNGQKERGNKDSENAEADSAVNADASHEANSEGDENQSTGDYSEKRGLGSLFKSIAKGFAKEGVKEAASVVDNNYINTVAVPENSTRRANFD